MKNLTLFTMMFLLLACTQEQKVRPPHFQIELGKVAPKAVFANDTMSIWGGSLVQGEDGLYHMYYSRWPKAIGWEWANYSEIAHAVSSSPFGPFEHRDVVLPDRGAEYWDGSCTHNPTIHKFDGKYYLYYMGNTGDKKIVSEPGKAKINWVHRNNQRIGVAVANSLDGPWERLDKPVIDISTDSLAWDALMTSNPSVCKMADGKILMVYKAVAKHDPLPGGGPVVHLVAIADSPTGPFKKYPDPVFAVEGERFPAEDPYIWYQKGKYRAIVKRMKHEGEKRIFSLVHYDSEDGVHWVEAQHFEISDRSVTWEDGSITKLDHLERPQVFFEKGEPIALLCAADTIDANNVRHSFNIQIPLKITRH